MAGRFADFLNEANSIDCEMLTKMSEFISTLSEDAVSGEVGDKIDAMFEAMIDVITSIDEEALDDDQISALSELVEELIGDEDESEEVSEGFYKKMSSADKQKAKAYRRKNASKLKAWYKKWNTKNKSKLERARKTGRGLSGKKLGVMHRR